MNWETRALAVLMYLLEHNLDKELLHVVSLVEVLLGPQEDHVDDAGLRLLPGLRLGVILLGYV